MYRTIDARFWTDPKVRQLDQNAKLLLLYLLTNPHTHLSGIYYLPMSVMVHETGLKLDREEYPIDTLSSLELAKFDPENDLVWVKNMMRYQGKGEKNEKGAASHVSSLHNSFLIQEFLAAYPGVSKYVKRYPIDGVSMGYPKKKAGATPEQEQEQEQEKKSVAKPKAAPQSKPPPRRDELFDAVASITHSDPKVCGSRIGEVCKALRAAEPPYTADEVLSLPGVVSDGWPEFRLPLTLHQVKEYILRVRNPPPRGNSNGTRHPSRDVRENPSRIAAKPGKYDGIATIVSAAPEPPREPAARDSAPGPAGDSPRPGAAPGDPPGAPAR